MAIASQGCAISAINSYATIRNKTQREEVGRSQLETHVSVTMVSVDFVRLTLLTAHIIFTQAGEFQC